MSDDTDALALTYPCTACGARPGEWCVTYRPTVRSPGYRTSWLHSPRNGPIYEALRIGARQGEEHVVQMIDAVANPDNQYADEAWLQKYLQRVRDRAT